MVFVKPFCFHRRRGGCVEGTGSWSPFGVEVRESGMGMRWAWRQGPPPSAPAGFFRAAGLQPGCGWSSELLPTEAVLSAACCVKEPARCVCVCVCVCVCKTETERQRQTDRENMRI